MLEVTFVDADDYRFTIEDRAVITAEATKADTLARRYLPLAVQLQLLVKPSTSVLDVTGDNAYTVSQDLITWSVDPRRGVHDLCRTRLVKSFLHEAYHAARFRRLADEADSNTWLEIAIGEGLATAFARDVADAHEPWSVYDDSTIQYWAQELTVAAADPADLTKWKFRHPDGRQWIAFRVGTWLVDLICQDRGATAAELVWTPTDELIPSLPRHLTDDRSRPGT